MQRHTLGADQQLQQRLRRCSSSSGCVGRRTQLRTDALKWQHSRRAHVTNLRGSLAFRQATDTAGAQTYYTAVDNRTDSTVFRPPLINMEPLLLGRSPSQEAIGQVRSGCESTGFLALTGHGISGSQLRSLFAAARSLFDQPLTVKQSLIVGNMTKGRGYEISPEHKEYMKAFPAMRASASISGVGSGSSGSSEGGSCGRKGNSGSSSSGSGSGSTSGAEVEPSALDGILSERFLCGPTLSDQQTSDPYYSQGLGPVFFAPDVWPDDTVAPGLRGEMQGCHDDMTRVANATLRLMAAALGLELDYFEAMTARHCSNLQVANYPSQLSDPTLLGLDNMRKKAHADSGTLTLLASEDWLPGGSWRPGDGGLQLLNVQGQWVEVAVPEGALLLNLGSILTRLTNGKWRSTLHRVTNPTSRHYRDHQRHASSTRRLSVAYFHKPNYDALIDVVPTCLDGSIPGGRRYEAMPASDLTRQGVLHKYAHLPQEEASRRYHEHMARTRAAA